MPNTGIIWGGWNKRLRIGIDVRWDNIDANSTGVHVWVDFYVSSQNAFNDRQYLNFTNSLGGRWEYTLNTPNGITDRFIGTYDIGIRPVNYGGSEVFDFGAYVTDAYEGSSPSIILNWATPARPPSNPGYPGMWVDSVTSNSARVVVTAAPDNGSGIDAYQVLVGTNGSSIDTIIASQIANFGGGTGYVYNLAPNTTYAAIARAHNGVGYGPWAGIAYFTTGATAPGQVTGVVATNIGVTNATLNWNVPSNGGSSITGYMQQFATDAAFTQNLLQYEWSAGNSTTNQLLPGQVYYVRVRARNGVNWGPWSATGSFSTLPGTPVIVSPTSWATRSDGQLDVTFTLQGAKSDTTVTVQVSQDGTFASGVKELTAPVSGNLVSGTTYRFRNNTLAQYQKNGSWAIRLRATTPSSGYTSPWTNGIWFVQSHQPSASLISPATGSVSKYDGTIPFVFSFADSSPIDRISAYQLEIQRNDTGAAVYDSGKVALSQTSTTITVSRAIDSSYKNVSLRWRVRVWDYGDTASAYTGWSVTRLTDTPVVAITAPQAGLVLDNGSPTFSWNFAAPSGGQQKSASVRVVDTSTSREVWATDIVGATFTVTPPGVILLNDRTYVVTVRVRDTFDLESSNSIQFSTHYVSPDSVNYSFNSSLADSDGYALVSWVNADPDSQFTAWKVYRRISSDTEWSLIATIRDQTVREYRDYMLVAGQSYTYSVTQVATRSGTDLESPVGYVRRPDGSGGYVTEVETGVTSPVIGSYWLISATVSSDSMRLEVKSDPRTLEFEGESYNIIGRGRHQDYGDRLGYSGTLTIQALGYGQINQTLVKIEELREKQDTYYLRTPFGRLFKVSLGNVGWDPMAGTGLNEMGTISLPYLEVA